MKKLIACCLLILLVAACGRGPVPDNGYPEYTPAPQYEEDDYTNQEPAHVDAPGFDRFDHYDISLTIDPATRTVTNGMSRIRFTNRTGDDLSEIVLRVPLNVFNESARHSFNEFEESVFRHGRDYGYMDIQYVTVDNEDLNFELDGTVLLLHLDMPLAPEATVQLVLQYSAYIPMIAHRVGANQQAMWFGMLLPMLAVYGDDGWLTNELYPAGDPFVLEMANFIVEITTPADYIVAGTGIKTGEIPVEDTDTRVTTFVANNTRDFAFAISPHFQQEWISTESGDIHLYYFTEDLPVDTILEIARLSMDYFSYRIRHYPFDHIRIIETDMYRDVMTFSNVIFIDTSALTEPNHEALTRALGHQWFFNVVGSDPVAESWLDKGLIRYLTARLINNRPALLLTYMNNIYAGVSAREDLYLSNGLGAFENWQDYYKTHHVKGMLMFNALSNHMSDDMFWELIRQYFQTFYFRIATGADFINLAEEIYGNSLASFFDEWFIGGAVPLLPDRQRLDTHATEHVEDEERQ
ncbi:MAG: M1 family metallopeptidase [Defluviitaleaceae bacterium]|nr:M1 family metallopeptidase [Defluviitaleaceae bacterium]